MTKQRRFRISCFAPGQQLTEACVRHLAPRTEERANRLFEMERKKVGEKYGFVVLHQGNLKRESYKIIRRADRWTREDALAYRHTAFNDFEELTNALGGFYPSLKVSDPEIKELADAYDAAMEAKRDKRRALRWEAGKI